MDRFLGLALTTAILLMSCGGVTEFMSAMAPVTGSPAATGDGTGLGRFENRRAMRHVKRLARGIGARVRGTRGELLGARYIAGKLEDYGYGVRIQKFSVDGRTSRNVIAKAPGGIRNPFVIGGHMDTVPHSPGANDNASGVAVMLETARLIKRHRARRFVKLIAFGSEEFGTDGRHHVGSQTFVDRIGKSGRRWTPGMISVDMIADGRPLIDGTAGLGPQIVARTSLRKIRAAGIGAVYRTTCDCSDNGPFERAGIPAAFLWSGDEPDYHSSSDTVAHLEPSDVARTGRALRAFVKSLDRKLVRRFRAR